jgi:uncharacterized protein YbjT (DUF2867 family)
MSANNVLIFGGTSGTGLAAAQVLAGRGDAVTVAVRESSDTSALSAAGVSTLLVDVFDGGSIREAFASGTYDTVVISLSGERGEATRADREGAINIIDVAAELAVQRVLMVTAIGCGDSRGAVAPKVVEVLGPVLDAKAVAEEHLMAAGLDWTILRPGGLTNDPASGTAIRTTDRNAMGVAHRADVGALVVECMDDPDSIGEIYATIDPEIKWEAPLQRGDDSRHRK